MLAHIRYCLPTSRYRLNMNDQAFLLGGRFPGWKKQPFIVFRWSFFSRQLTLIVLLVFMHFMPVCLSLPTGHFQALRTSDCGGNCGVAGQHIKRSGMHEELGEPSAAQFTEVELVGEWVTVQAAELAAHFDEQTAGSVDAAALFPGLCSESTDRLVRFPGTKPTLTLGQKFIGSASNFRGLRDSGLCLFTSAHAQFLPYEALYSNISARLGVTETTHGLFNASAPQLLQARVPLTWSAGD